MENDAETVNMFYLKIKIFILIKYTIKHKMYIK